MLRRKVSEARSRDGERLRRFEEAVLPHLDAAYNLSRWLTRSDEQAEEVLQSACLRALQFFDGFHGQNARAWLMTIVRNTFYSWVRRHHTEDQVTQFDEDLHGGLAPSPDPELQLLRSADGDLLRRGLEQLPPAFREVIVLREIEGLAYKEIAAVVGIPIGTVMSRLARARRQLQEFLLTHGLRGSRS